MPQVKQARLVEGGKFSLLFDCVIDSLLRGLWLRTSIMVLAQVLVSNGGHVGKRDEREDRIDR